MQLFLEVKEHASAIHGPLPVTPEGNFFLICVALGTRT